jgi:hypothetical protein
MKPTQGKGSTGYLRSTRKIGGTFPFRIAVAFLVFGVLSLIFSVSSKSEILAFIGLGLLFWGVLFLLTRPTKYVEGSLLDSVATSEYSTIDRIIRSFQYGGKGYYIPPYPKDARIPEHLKGLKDMVVFLSANSNAIMPSIEDVVEGRFLPIKSKGALVTPPGFGLLTQIEKQFRIDFNNMELIELCEVLPRLFTEDFNLAKAMEMNLSENEVSLKIFDSLFQNLHRTDNGSMSVNLLGCPIASAVACALAKTSGKIVTIQTQLSSSDGLIIEVRYRFVQG